VRSLSIAFGDERSKIIEHRLMMTLLFMLLNHTGPPRKIASVNIYFVRYLYKVFYETYLGTKPLFVLKLERSLVRNLKSYETF